MITVYFPMPIDKQKVRELNARGYKIVDAEFAPDGYELPAELQPAKPRRKSEPVAE